MPGAKPAPIASRANEKSTRAKSLQVKPFNRHSLRDGFTAYSALSPGNRAFLPPSPVGSSPTGLMSASRHQDHTASPSALPAFVFARQERPPHPALNTRDDRVAPLLLGARDGAEDATDFSCRQSELFFAQALESSCAAKQITCSAALSALSWRACRLR